MSAEFDMVRSKVINFHSMQSIIIAKLKSKNSQITELCEHEIDTGGDGNVMPIRRFKVLYLNLKIMDLNKSLDKK